MPWTFPLSLRIAVHYQPGHEICHFVAFALRTGHAIYSTDLPGLQLAQIPRYDTTHCAWTLASTSGLLPYQHVDVVEAVMERLFRFDLGNPWHRENRVHGVEIKHFRQPGIQPRLLKCEPPHDPQRGLSTVLHVCTWAISLIKTLVSQIHKQT